MNPSASSYSYNVDLVIVFIVTVGVIILASITAFTIFCLVRYNEKRNPTPANIDGNVVLETTWTVVPLILTMIMFYLGYDGFVYMRRAPKDAMLIKVNAHMWAWSFEYPNGVVTEKLIIPLGKPVEVLLHSSDVIHGFYIPAFRAKEDVVPGKNNYLWFVGTEEGVFDILCSQYCGELHSSMRTTVEVVQPDEFKAWYASSQGSSTESSSPEVTKGREIYQNRGGCALCHNLDKPGSNAPSLKSIFGKKVTVITHGKEQDIVVDEEYIRRSLLAPDEDIVKGFEKEAPMPSYYGTLDKDEIDALISYIKQLK